MDALQVNGHDVSHLILRLQGLVKEYRDFQDKVLSNEKPIAGIILKKQQTCYYGLKLAKMS